MILFDKDKEIIFKITNAVLLIWLVGAVLFTFSNVIDMALDQPFQSFEEYKNYNCSAFDKEETDRMTNADCKKAYEFSNDYENRQQTKSLLISIINVITVFGVLFFLNKPRKKIK